jgi:hypothetical protein
MSSNAIVQPLDRLHDVRTLSDDGGHTLGLGQPPGDLDLGRIRAVVVLAAPVELDDDRIGPRAIGAPHVPQDLLCSRARIGRPVRVDRPGMGR